MQVEVAKQKGGIGFLFWNANNDYSKPYTAMPEMRAAKGQYFRGDEVGVKTETGVASAATPAAVSVNATASAAVNGNAPAAATQGGAAQQPGSAPSDSAPKAQKIWRH